MATPVPAAAIVARRRHQPLQLGHPLLQRPDPLAVLPGHRHRPRQEHPLQRLGQSRRQLRPDPSLRHRVLRSMPSSAAALACPRSFTRSFSKARRRNSRRLSRLGLPSPGHPGRIIRATSSLMFQNPHFQ